jgi:hypothetical protein
MLKILLVLAAVGVLVFSARMSGVHHDQVFIGQGTAAGLTMSDLSRELKLVPGLTTPQAERSLLAGAGENDGPAAALVVYMACILVGSVVGVALTRRIQREL